MPIKSETVPCNFVGEFKVGDNLVFNARILSKLADTNESGIFNKLIALQVGSMLEAALSQIIYRAQNYNREGVTNIPEDDRAEIEGKKIDKFNTVIDVLKKYKSWMLSELAFTKSFIRSGDIETRYTFKMTLKVPHGTKRPPSLKRCAIGLWV